jgi:hypothetical protein
LKKSTCQRSEKVINDAQEKPYKKPEYVNSQSYHLLLELIDKTRSQLANSRKRLSAEPSSSTTAVVHLGDCFIPENFPIHHVKKTFSIMPHYGFRRQYIDIDIATLRIIVNRSSRTQSIAVNDQSIKADLFKDAKFFMSLFDLKKTAPLKRCSIHNI